MIKVNKMQNLKIYFNRLKKKLSKKILFKSSIKLVPEFEIYIITFKSLFYNHHLNKSYAIDTLLEPLFWLVDNFTQTLGPFFVFLIIILISLFIIIAYTIGLPFWLDRNLKISIFALILGNYLLINVIFHYYMAWKTHPGILPSNIIIKNSVSICKKCILPKPPRTHHCSVCDKCILKMDHHCPWLNNCIGFYNYRYFFMFCLFVWIGTIFVIFLGLPIALEHYFQIDLFKNDFKYSLLFYLYKKQNSSYILNNTIEQNNKKYLEKLGLNYYNIKNNCVVFVILGCVSCFFAVGGLMIWHFKLITKAETCIETHINKKEIKRLEKIKEKFINPFDEGWKKNWKNFFGLSDQHKISYRHIFLPSTHKPHGNGIDWNIFSE